MFFVQLPWIVTSLLAPANITKVLDEPTMSTLCSSILCVQLFTVLQSQFSLLKRKPPNKYVGNKEQKR